MNVVVGLVIGLLIGVVGIVMTKVSDNKATEELVLKTIEETYERVGEISLKYVDDAVATTKKSYEKKVAELKAKNIDLTLKNANLMLEVLEANKLTKELESYKSKAELYDKLWNQEADKTNDIISEVIDTIADEIDQITNTDNVQLGFESKTTVNNGSYGYNTDDNGKITNEQILISPIVIFDDRQKRHIDYLNKEFGLRLAYDNKTSIIMTFLHETGHCIDYHTRNDIKDYANKNQELKAQLSEYESQEESDYQYRQIPCERYADEFAVKMIKKYYPELAYAC